MTPHPLLDEDNQWWFFRRRNIGVLVDSMEGTDIERLFSGCLNIPFVFTATIGNVLVLGAIWRTSGLHSAAYVLVFSLALSDLGVGLIC